ncbi:MAG: hypothetical protein MI866_15395 [Bacteroidales bacterium]|nr:hypothetical protein [Bacteroidales bacterium]
MEPNMLDEFFRKRLKDHSELPQGMLFDKKRLFNSLEQQVGKTDSIKLDWKYAVAILLFLISGYWHWHQNNLITEQQQKLAQQSGYADQAQKQYSKLIAGQYLIIDSLLHHKTNVKERMQTVRLPSLPAVVTTNKLTIAPTATIIVHEPIYITDKNIPDQKSQVPELNLPVYYESERMAYNTSEASSGQSFKRKLTELLNN